MIIMFWVLSKKLRLTEINQIVHFEDCIKMYDNLKDMFNVVTKFWATRIWSGNMYLSDNVNFVEYDCSCYMSKKFWYNYS